MNCLLLIIAPTPLFVRFIYGALHSENKNEWGSFCIFTHLHYLCEEYCTLSHARRLNDK